MVHAVHVVPLIYMKNACGAIIRRLVMTLVLQDKIVSFVRGLLILNMRLSTPSCKIRKEKRSGSLVSPKDMTIISAVNMEGRVSPQATAPSTSSAPPVSFVTSAQFEAMNDKWVEQLACFEALLPGETFSALLRHLLLFHLTKCCLISHS